MNNFYLMIILFGLILGTGRFTLEMFLRSLNRDLQRKVSKDVFLGNTAEALIRSEKSVAQSNRLLTRLHLSCPAILLMPPPAMLKALNAGRTLSKALKLSQEASRVSTQIILASARTRGYQANDSLSKERSSNACRFAGPIKNLHLSHVEINDHEAGIQFRADPVYFWSFEHPSSRSIWF